MRVTPINDVTIANDGSEVTIVWDNVQNSSSYAIIECENKNIIAEINSSDANNYTIKDVANGEHCYILVANDLNREEIARSSSLSTDVTSGKQSIYTIDVSPDTSEQFDTTPNTANVSKLVSTGASLWVNILVALAIIIPIAYFMFRKDIWKK